MAQSPRPADAECAQRLLRDCEIDLNRKLTMGERRDLLADNTPWSMDYIALVAEQIVGVR